MPRATLDDYTQALTGTYGVPLRVLARGEGSYVWDTEGNKYLDLLGGIAVNALGHAHPAWIRAVTEQAGAIAHTSNFFATEPQIQLAQTLLRLADAPTGSRVFFCNSGTEANEAAFKMGRKTGKSRTIALEGGFHGRSMGALSMTHKPAIREPFQPMVAGVEFVAPDDIAQLEAAFAAGDVAAMILETVQGERGIVPISTAYLQAARELCTQHDALLIVDEIQTGVARSGAWFAHQLHGIQPDVMTLAKGLGGGFPVGAVVTFGERAATLLGKGDHGTTYGGNPLASAAALATLNAIESEHLIENVKTLGEHVRTSVEALDGVEEVRGDGLLLGIGLSEDIAAEVAAAALEAGFIINAPAPDTIRLAPALNVTAHELDTFIVWLAEYLTSRPQMFTEEDA